MGFKTGFFPWMHMGWWFQSSPRCCTHVECLSTLLGLHHGHLWIPLSRVHGHLWIWRRRIIVNQIILATKFYKNMIEKPGIPTTLKSVFFWFAHMTSRMWGFFSFGIFSFFGSLFYFCFRRVNEFLLLTLINGSHKLSLSLQTKESGVLFPNVLLYWRENSKLICRLPKVLDPPTLESKATILVIDKTN
jgi:hypothetical protein